MHILLPLQIKWIFRIGLLGFYLFGIWSHLQGNDFFGWLVRDHIHITVTLVFLTIVTFGSPFLRVKRKTHDGGEKEMRKLAWFVIILFAAVLAIAIGCAVNDSFKASVVNTLLGVGGWIWVSLSTTWSHWATIIGTSGTYFLIYTISILLAGGALFVGLIRLRNSGRLPSLRGTSSTTEKKYMGGPDFVPPTEIPASKSIESSSASVAKPEEQT